MQPAFVPGLRLRGGIWGELVDPDFERALARNTPPMRRRYERELFIDAREFHQWCRDQGKCPLPADDRDIYIYFDYLHHELGLQLPNLRRRYTAIRALHMANGYARGPSELVANFMRVRSATYIVRRKTPFTPEDIEAMCKLAIERHSAFRAARDIAIILFAYWSAERPAEFLALMREHYKIEDGGIIHRIPHSKSNPNGERLELHQVGRVPLPGQCPVDAINYWVTLAKIESGPVFRKISRKGTLGKTALTGASYRRILKTYVEALGLMGNYGGYSTRRGWATNAQKNTTRPAIRQYLRQRDESTTEIYLDAIPVPWHRVPTAAALR